MILMKCDGCEKHIDRDADRWFGVDLNEPIVENPDPVEALNEAEAQMVTALKVSINGDHEFHFCSPDCMSGWAFSRSLS